MNITPKQQEILTLIYRFRFLNRHHIQTLLNHKDPKRINVWLKDLTTKKILGRNYSTKLKENTKPAIYYLASKSRKILIAAIDADEKILRRAYRDKNASAKLIEHSTFVGTLYLQLRAQALENNQELHFYTKTDLTNHEYLPTTKPDAYIALKTDTETKRYFLEVIDEGTPRFMLRKRITDLVEYFSGGSWSTTMGHANPALLFICPNQHTHAFLNKYIPQALEEELLELQCFLMLRSNTQTTVINSESWQQVDS